MVLKIVINAIGKINDKELISLNNEYIKRIKWKIQINEFGQSSNNDIIINKRVEAQKLWPSNIINAYVIALDEGGKQYKSQEFAQHLKALENQGIDCIYFLLGGAEGHCTSTKSNANEMLSLSKLTLPHKLARLILIEQIYRAYTICINHPYHR